MTALSRSPATSHLVAASIACWLGAGCGLFLREIDALPLALLGLLATWKAARRSGLQRGWLCLALVASIAAWSCRTSFTEGPSRAIDSPLIARLLGAESGVGGFRLTLRGASGERLEVNVPLTGLDSFDLPNAGVVPGALIALPLRLDDLDAGQLKAISANAIQVVEPPRGVWSCYRVIQLARHQFARHAQRRLWQQSIRDRASGALLLAMVAGRDNFIPAGDWEDLRASGLAHVAVASGVQVAIIASAATLLLAPWWGRHHPLRRSVMLLSVAAACGFLLPFDPPILRAGLALIWVVLAKVWGRGVGGLGALAFAVIVLLSETPAIGASLSFALTVGATLALIVAGSGTMRMRWLALLLAPMSVTQPLIIMAFGRIAPWGVIANVAIAPAAVPAVIGGWLVLLLPPKLWGVTTLHVVTELSAWWILEVSREVACWPWSGRLVAPAGAIWLIGSLAAAAVWWLGSRAWRGFGFGLWAVLAVWPCVSHWRRVEPSLDVIDVGQGQAVLLTDSQHAVLVDAGPGHTRGAAKNLLEQLRVRGVKRLTRLIVTHADSDHIGGIRDVLAAAPPDCLMVPAGAIDSPRLRSLFSATARRGIPIQPICAGDSWRDGTLQVRAIHPSPGQRGDGNDTSAVLQLQVGSFSALAMGDAGRSVEQQLRLERKLEPTELLIVGHHGSGSSTEMAFLRTIRPRVAVISCGVDNRFRHPHPETLENLRTMGLRTFITARHGSVAYKISGGHRQIGLTPSAIRKRDRMWHKRNHQHQDGNRSQRNAAPVETLRLIEQRRMAPPPHHDDDRPNQPHGRGSPVE